MSCWLPPSLSFFQPMKSIQVTGLHVLLAPSLPPSLPLIFLTYEINTGDWSSCLVGSLPPSLSFF